MNNNIIIRSLLETLLGWVLLALLMTQLKDVTFAEALLMPHTVVLMVSAFVGACVGYRRKALKKQGTV